MKTTTKIILGVVAVILIAGTVLYSKAVKSVPNDGVNSEMRVLDNIRGLRFCELFFIGGNGITGNLAVAIYSTIGRNYDVSKDSLNSAPQNLVDQLDLPALKKNYDLLSVYFNKPRFYIMDRLDVPTGAERTFNGLNMNWVASGHIQKPKGDMNDPGWLRYKKTPVERSTTITFKAGKPVFLLDDPDGKVWCMKAYRDSYGQTYASLNTLGARYKDLPAGYKFRVVVLDRDLILKPTGSLATIMQDEFENTYDYLGDGSSNYIP